MKLMEAEKQAIYHSFLIDCPKFYTSRLSVLSNIIEDDVMYRIFEDITMGERARAYFDLDETNAYNRLKSIVKAGPKSMVKSMLVQYYTRMIPSIITGDHSYIAFYSSMTSVLPMIKVGNYSNVLIDGGFNIFQDVPEKVPIIVNGGDGCRVYVSTYVPDLKFDYIKIEGNRFDVSFKWPNIRCISFADETVIKMEDKVLLTVPPNRRVDVMLFIDGKIGNTDNIKKQLSRPGWLYD